MLVQDGVPGRICLKQGRNTGGGGGTRTHDRRFRRPMLYPLSYAPVFRPLLYLIRLPGPTPTEAPGVSLGLLQHVVDQAIVFGFLGGHELVPLEVSGYLLH